MLRMRGFASKLLETGTSYHAMHYSADPAKGPSWARETMRGVPKREWRREMELDEDVPEGTPVWEEYVDAIHCIKSPKTIPIISGSRYYGGWDGGTSRMPAFALLQVTPELKQLQWILEVVPESGMAMETFAPIVKTQLRALLPNNWASIIHVGDATVKTKGGAREESSIDVARDFGFNIKPISNARDPRERATIHFLQDYISQDGPEENWMPRMIYSEVGCPTLVDGMRGAYCLGAAPGGDDRGPGMIVQLPKKNFYSHVNDGHQQVLVHLEKEFRGRSKNRRARTM